jgi:hypothetical protein
VTVDWIKPDNLVWAYLCFSKKQPQFFISN